MRRNYLRRQDEQGGTHPRALYLDTDSEVRRVAGRSDSAVVLGRGEDSGGVFWRGWNMVQSNTPALQEAVRQEVEQCDLLTGVVASLAWPGGTASWLAITPHRSSGPALTSRLDTRKFSRGEMTNTCSSAV